MPPALRNAPFCNPSANDTKITNTVTPCGTSEANASEAATIRITSIPKTVGSNGHDSQALRSRAMSALSRTPSKKVTMAERGPSIARHSPAATATAASTKFPVTCPVKVLARTKPAASPYPPTKASPNESHASVFGCLGGSSDQAMDFTATVYFALNLRWNCKPLPKALVNAETGKVK